MNAPPKHELFDQPDEKKVHYIPDEKLPNAGTFKILHEDHTMGNMLRMQLLSDKNVLFAGYRIPHPLENFVEIRVQTEASTTPIAVFNHALTQLMTILNQLETGFQQQIQTRTHRR